jgi:hypothetical protein
MVSTKNVWLRLLMSPPILPENPKPLLYLTFSSSSHRWSSTCVRLPTLSGRSRSATRHRCSARLCCCPLPLMLGHAAQDSCAPASAGCVEADRPAPAASSGRSPLLGVAFPAVAGVAQRPGVCPAPDRPRLAAPAAARALATVALAGNPGRPTIAKEVRDLICTMWQAYPTWGSPRIVRALRKLGMAVATSTVEQERPRPKKPFSPTWKTLVKNRVQDWVALDCFVVPTVTFQVLFVLVLLAHERRRVLQLQ